MSAQLFDLKNCLLSVNSLPMGGYGQNDAMVVEWADDILYDMVSADGQVVVSRVNDPRMRVGLSFLQTSQSVPLLMAMVEAQAGNQAGFGPPIILPYPFLYKNFTTGTVISSSHTFFLNRPAPGAAKSVGEVQFRLLLPQPTYEFGTLNRNTIVQP